MRQSKLTKVTALMLSLVMITSVFVGNTLSRYVTSVSSTDSARVAVWGINGGETQMNLFDTKYIVDGKAIAAANDNGDGTFDKIMAPGTEGEAPFSIINFEQDVAPEVAYQVALTFDDSAIADEIKNNPSVQWKLDDGAWGTLEQLKTSILSLSGDASGVKVYAPGQFAIAFEDNTPHTIAWQWLLDNDETITVDEVCDAYGNCENVYMPTNEYDTYMGNLSLDGDLEAVVTVGITATQIDGTPIGNNILEGSGAVFNLSDPQVLTFRSLAPLDEFQSVTINGEEVNSEHYIKEEGSTIIKLDKNYLATFEENNYNISIISKNMTADGTFLVEDKPIIHNKVIPEGGFYITGNTDPGLGQYSDDAEFFEAGDVFPNEVKTGDAYVYFNDYFLEDIDYEYRYNMVYLGTQWVDFDTAEAFAQQFLGVSLNLSEGWGVAVADKTKTKYTEPLTSINGKDVVNLITTFAECTSLIEAPVLPDNVTNMIGAFADCTSLTKAPVIPNDVIHMENTFSGCTSLEIAPVIPDSVIYMYHTFYDCEELKEVPYISNNVVDMEYTFYDCKSLTKVAIIPGSVVNMLGTFMNCESLEVAPVIISGDNISMYNTFRDCTSLIEVPIIPDGVVDMSSTFAGCTSLVNAPVIPSSVTDMSHTFYECTSLTGTIEINANPTSYNDVFNGTTNPITLTGSSTILNEIAATASNVTVQE